MAHYDSSGSWWTCAYSQTNSPWPAGDKSILRWNAILWIDNLNDSTTAASLETLFSEFGDVSEVQIISPPEGIRSPRGALIGMLNVMDARKALWVLDGTEFDGRVISVTLNTIRTDPLR
jgi:RNA recognition motif-containing protein